MSRALLSTSSLSHVRRARRQEHSGQTPRVAVWRRNALGDEKDERNSPDSAASTSQPQQERQRKKIVERLKSTITSGLRSFPLPDLDEDSRAMLSELISPPPSDSNGEEDSDDDVLVVGGSGARDSDDLEDRGGDDGDDDSAAVVGTSGRSSSSSSSSSKKSPPSLGARGGGWVLAQFVALFFVIFPPTAVTLSIQILGVFAILGGIALAAAGVGSIGVKSLSPFPAPRKSNQLAEKGAYSLVRHPMYGGLLLFAFGAAASSASPGRAAAAAALFYILESKIAIEEKGMRKKHGKMYDDYASRTRKMIPFVW